MESDGSRLEDARRIFRYWVRDPYSHCYTIVDLVDVIPDFRKYSSFHPLDTSSDVPNHHAVRPEASGEALSAHHYATQEINFTHGRTRPWKLGLGGAHILHPGFCFVEMCQARPCPNGAQYVGRHCPPISEEVKLLLCLTALDRRYTLLGRNFVFNCLKYYFIKYYQHGTYPVLTPLGQGSHPVTEIPAELYVDRDIPLDFFKDQHCEDIIKEWDVLFELNKGIVNCPIPAAPRPQAAARHVQERP